MGSDSPTAPVSKKLMWAGWIVSGLPALMLVYSGVMKVMKPPVVVEGFAHLGYPERFALVIGIVEIACTILYALPRTRVLGAILLTGYLGGATASHVRLGEVQFLGAVGFGVLVWLGLFLRDARLRALLPLTRPPGP